MTTTHTSQTSSTRTDRFMARSLAAGAVGAALLLGVNHLATGQAGDTMGSAGESSALEVPLHRIASCDVSLLAFELMQSEEFVAARQAEETRIGRDTRAKQTQAIISNAASDDESARAATASAVIQSNRQQVIEFNSFQAQQLREAHNRIVRAIKEIAERERYAYVIGGRSTIDFAGLDPRQVYIALGQSTILYGPAGIDLTDQVREKLGLEKPVVVPQISGE